MSVRKINYRNLILKYVISLNMIKYFKYIKLLPCMYYKTIRAIFQTFFYSDTVSQTTINTIIYFILLVAQYNF